MSWSLQPRFPLVAQYSFKTSTPPHPRSGTIALEWVKEMDVDSSWSLLAQTLLGEGVDAQVPREPVAW